ncbi:hypothetical protein [Arachidicoccus ginsenosidivorans]|uniref:hypothetical protein n=1 Tax=Arachidicoccus ginsenosidivorans TaxID=496057 RepID=UPI001315475E|nr:hypothetical protein [Arachidicoccus ginsenosidivorans]
MDYGRDVLVEQRVLLDMAGRKLKLKVFVVIQNEFRFSGWPRVVVKNCDQLEM